MTHTDSRGSGWASEQASAGTAVGAPAHDDGSGQTSVPERPPRRQSQSRAKGPGHLAGTLTADPELRFTGSGKSLTKMRVAMNERTRDPESGQYVDGETRFVDVNVWGRQAENVADQLRKGDRVVVTGMWTEEGWENREGQWQTRTTMLARDVGPSMLFRPARVLRDKEVS